MNNVKRFFSNFKSKIAQFFLNKKKRTYFILFASILTTISACVLITAICSINYPDYIYIKDEEDLNKLREKPNGDFIFTKQNLNITQNWVPIGTESVPFTGSILGNDCTISFSLEDFIFAESENYNYFGFIGFNEGSIKGLNFYVHNTNLVVSNEKESVFGCISAFNSGSISTCSVIQASGNVNISSNKSIYAGSIAGMGSNNFVKLSSSLRLNISTSSSAVVGGVVGMVDKKTTLWESTAINLITANDIHNFLGGGLIGSASQNAIVNITNCVSRNTFLPSSGTSGLIGGVIGKSSSSNFIIENIYSNCNITNYPGIKCSNFVCEGKYEIRNCISNPTFIHDDSECGFGSFAFEEMTETSFEYCFYTRTFNYSFDFYGEYSALDKISLNKMNWDTKLWRKNTDGGFELI